MQEVLSNYFGDIGVVLFRNLNETLNGLLLSGSSSVWSIARKIAEFSGRTFKASEKLVNRLLQDKNFQINDNLWRKYINLLFSALIERNLLKLEDNILLRIDYTTDTDDFLILTASVDFCGKSVPLYFSMRKYPKKKGQINQKKLESSFFKELRHLLSKKYKYMIVADRGFGNDRIAQLCAENKFSYVLRICDNLNIIKDGEELNLQAFKGCNCAFKAHVSCWKKDVHFEVKTKNKSTWFLIKSDEKISGADVYEKRFSIEKCFQDMKSSGFNIEKCKIRKYDRFKRLCFLVSLAQLFAVIVGEYIENKKHPLKKRFPILVAGISAFSKSDGLYSKLSSETQLVL